MSLLALDLSEKEWTTQVVELATMFQWKRYHTYRSKHSPAGWPDEALVRDRLILLELKTEKGKLSEAQRGWLGALLHAGVETYVARPRDLDDLALILACRGNPLLKSGPTAEAAAVLRARTQAETEGATA